MDTLDLSTIAATLESLEETIIFKLIDRAQFAYNADIYNPLKSGFIPNPQKSLFELRMTHQETMDSLFGRFLVPEERPFTSNLPKPMRNVSIPQTGLCLSDYNAVNTNTMLMNHYLEFIRALCTKETDGHFGSSVEHDVYAIQAIARRIHYGALYVAESKFRGNPAEYNELISQKNETALLQKLTRIEVEEAILMRIRTKTASIQTTIRSGLRVSVNPDTIVDFYKNTIIPLTKTGEIKYLMAREKESA